MNLRRITARTAIAGVSTALAAGALVGVTSTTANAVDNTSNYDCTALGASQGSFALKISTPVLPDTATAGQSFPGGLLELTANITVPPASAQTLSNFGVTGGRIDDYAGSLGTTKLKAPLVFAAPQTTAGVTTMAGTGSVAAFTLPKAGKDAVQLPAAFTFTPTTASGDLTFNGVPITLACTSAAPGNLGFVQITKAKPVVKAKSAKAGKKFKVTVSVTRPLAPSPIKPSGKVVAKYGKKSVTKKLKKGKVVLVLPKAAKGKKITITYKGDSYVKGGKVVIKKLK